MTQENKPTKRQIIVLVIVTVLALAPTLAGFILYALPKFLISKYLLKSKDVNRVTIIKDTIIIGIILGTLAFIGNYSDLKDKQNTINQSTTQAQ